jgi:phospholipid/cholesterol/gamma-HCH transport system substrate-binding protein
MSRAARLGAFILITFAILVTGIFIIGGKRYLFTATYGLHTQFANVAGLSAGADVLVGGVHSGTVKSIELPKTVNDKVTVYLQLDNKTHSIIKQDSAASIQTEGLLGSQFISISFGSAGAADVKDGDSIASVPPLEVAALFDKANGLLDSSRLAMNNIVQITANLNSVTGKINQGDGTVGALVNDKKMYNDLEQTTATARQTVTAAQTGIVDFQENMEALKHNFLLRGYFKNRGYEDASDLEKDEITNLPEAQPTKDFTLQSKQIFDKEDSAKLKNQKQLAPAGEYLAGNDFGLAVVEVSTGSTGDSDSQTVLAQGRAMVVRQYLVDHYGFDDTKLKTVAIGKSEDKSDGNWGLVKVVIYPVGTAVPADKKPPAKAVEKPVAAAAPAPKN